MNCPREVGTLFELRLGLKIEISDSFVNHPTRSQSKLDDGSKLTVSEVTTCCISTRGWIDTCHDLGRVRKWSLHFTWLEHLRWFVLHIGIVH